MDSAHGDLKSTLPLIIECSIRMAKVLREYIVVVAQASHSFS